MEDVELPRSTDECPERSYTPLIVGAFLFATLVVCAFLFALFLDRPPKNFPTDTIFTIEKGAPTAAIMADLKENNLIRSSTYFKFLLWMHHQNAFIQAGAYAFDRPLHANEVARAITSGEHILPPVSLTFFEGIRSDQMVEILKRVLPESEEDFRAEVFDEHIGYLFPDTYYVSDDITSEELITLMRETFNEKTLDLKPQIEASGLQEDEIVTLASIIEREANTEESMRIVSGILQERLRIGMPLQVDATFEYVLGKTSAELTQEDLEIDSPYNTYTHRGLPPTPIANPGLQAIEAVLDPIETKYLYYITGNDGVFYYAQTFEEHKRNKEQHLW